MKLLLDECVPRKLKNHLPAIDCQTVPEASLAGKKNGELLRLAELAGFEVLLTVDQGIEYQQNLQRARRIGRSMEEEVRGSSSRPARYHDHRDCSLPPCYFGNAQYFALRRFFGAPNRPLDRVSSPS